MGVWVELFTGDKFFFPGADSGDYRLIELHEDDEDWDEDWFDRYEVYDGQLNIVAEIPEGIVWNIIAEDDEDSFDPAEWPTDSSKYVWDDNAPPFIYGPRSE